MAGTVRISRDIFGHECFADEPLTEREAWVWLIMEAAWKPHTRRVGDYIVDVDRGQVAASVRFMASAWKWTPAKVQRFTKRLIRLGMISAKTDTGVSVVTICNYDEYQAPAQAADTGAIQVRYRSDTKEKEGKEREEGKDTEANASDADASSPSLKEQVWARGVRFLVARGIADRQARSVIGLWLKVHSDGEVFDAFIAADKERPVEPVAWITARLGRPSQRSELDAAFAQLGERMAAQ